MLRPRSTVIRITQQDMDMLDTRNLQPPSLRPPRRNVPRRPSKAPHLPLPARSSPTADDDSTLKDGPEKQTKALTIRRASSVHSQYGSHHVTDDHVDHDPHNETDTTAAHTGDLDPSTTVPGRNPLLDRLVTIAKHEALAPELAFQKQKGHRPSKSLPNAWDSRDSDSHKRSQSCVNPSVVLQASPAQQAHQDSRTSSPAVQFPLYQSLSPLDRFIKDLGSVPQSPRASQVSSSTHDRLEIRLLSGEVFYRSPSASDSDSQISSSRASPVPDVSPVVEPSHYIRVSQETPQRLGHHFKSPSNFTSSPLEPRCQSSHRAASTHTHSSSPCNTPGQVNYSVPRRRRPGQTPRTPRVRVYDDDESAVLQPQTPADLRRATRGTNPKSMRSIHKALHPALIPAGESRYPIMQNLTSPATTDRGAEMMTRTQEEQDVRPTASLLGRPPRHHQNQENRFDPAAMGIARELRAIVQSRPGETASMENTPPRSGRFEQYLR